MRPALVRWRCAKSARHRSWLKSWGKATPATWFGKVIDTYGAERIAWGSNFPNSVGTLKEILDAARKAFDFAKPSDQDMIFGKTAQTIYPVLKD